MKNKKNSLIARKNNQTTYITCNEKVASEFIQIFKQTGSITDAMRETNISEEKLEHFLSDSVFQTAISTIGRSEFLKNNPSILSVDSSATMLLDTIKECNEWIDRCKNEKNKKIIESFLKIKTQCILKLTDIGFYKDVNKPIENVVSIPSIPAAVKHKSIEK